MSGLDQLDLLFIASAFLFQTILIVHFALRRWRFDFAIRYGPVVYALSLPAAAVSLLLLGDKPWAFWLAGFLYLIWAAYGYFMEYVKRLEWRAPFRWSIGGPYLALYLATAMFYWWPLALLHRSLWYGYAILFITSTILNVTSHKGPQVLPESGLPSP
jgi:hypothetical protein